MKREAYFDNAKWILMFLVVFGHVIQPYKDQHSIYSVLYQWVYTFHMPAFIIVSGYFAQANINKAYVGKLFKKLLLPYLSFQAIYTIYYALIGKSGWWKPPFEPQWALWFLVSLFCWHIMLYWYRRLPKHVAILISIQIGVLVGYMSGIDHSFSLSRTFVFFPFFLIGHWIGSEELNWLRETRTKVLALGVMLSVALAIIFGPSYETEWFFGSKSYVTLGMPEWGGLIRFGTYIVSILMAFSVLSWIPTKTYTWTKYGAYTLYVYLLHGFVIQVIREHDLISVYSPFDLVYLATFSLLLMGLFVSRPVVSFVSPIIQWRSIGWKVKKYPTKVHSGSS
ncbi:acyltransferase family protein [Pontibacillus sp. ALD_SL1]|uniref:acyltransferase family protein n=1 Tax=Pontibacillus sp. ALD_SL1 TaxID=2777185 RepID=UPI001A977075|nr:acyltransferase family protein [Pontibacillus sp. ALD_SL1]QSS99911.1 acyltransferase family protein [Pontibacillus sp. ALD_SL1]